MTTSTCPDGMRTPITAAARGHRPSAITTGCSTSISARPMKVSSCLLPPTRMALGVPCIASRPWRNGKTRAPSGTMMGRPISDEANGELVPSSCIACRLTVKNCLTTASLSIRVLWPRVLSFSSATDTITSSFPRAEWAQAGRRCCAHATSTVPTSVASYWSRVPPTSTARIKVPLSIRPTALGGSSISRRRIPQAASSIFSPPDGKTTGP